MAPIKSKIHWHWNWLIAGLLILVNGVMLILALQSTISPHVVEPIKDAEVDKLLTYIASGKHAGESWQITLSNLEAEQTITWYLKKYPNIPFAYPKVEITPNYIKGSGDVTVAGVRFHVGATVNITLKDGLPVVKILSLDLPLALQWTKQPVEQAVQKALERAADLPVRFTSAEWKDGVVIVKGTIR